MTDNLLIPDPRFANLRDWADQMVTNITTDIVPILADETRWREWGEVVVALPGLSAQAYPAPQGYLTWDSWATALWLAASAPESTT